MTSGNPGLRSCDAEAISAAATHQPRASRWGRHHSYTHVQSLLSKAPHRVRTSGALWPAFGVYTPNRVYSSSLLAAVASDLMTEAFIERALSRVLAQNATRLSRAVFQYPYFHKEGAVQGAGAERYASLSDYLSQRGRCPGCWRGERYVSPSDYLSQRGRCPGCWRGERYVSPSDYLSQTGRCPGCWHGERYASLSDYLDYCFGLYMVRSVNQMDTDRPLERFATRRTLR
ncbi:unnamed protein product [Boreogadus saida]